MNGPAGASTPSWRTLERLFAWAGAGLFLSSLAVTAWLYGRRFAATGDFNGWTPVLIDALLLGVFAAHHSAFARARTKTALARRIPERLLRALYVWVASLLLIAVMVWWQAIGGGFYQAEGLARWLLRAVQLTGIGLVVGSVRAIRALELAGVQPPTPGESLQTRGPYRLVRHPLYLGWVLVVFGTPHLTGDRLAFAAMTTIYLLVAIPWEERALEQAFGAAYARYKIRVPWRLLPFIY